MKRKLQLIMFIMATVYTVLPAQKNRGTITGEITDENGHRLPGATVVIDSLSTGVAADNEGRFMFRNLRYGEYTLRASYTGYDSKEFHIDLSGDYSFKIVLKEATFIAGDVIVRSNRAGVRTPVAHSTVDAVTLQRADMTRDIPYLLALTPSVVETSDAGNGVGYTSLRIRGSDASRINVTVDGVPLNDAESQQVFWVDLPDLASSTGSIQIQRGAGTSTNGAGAFGASVNINTQALPEEAGAAVDLDAGSFNTFRATAKAWTGTLNDHFNMMIRASSLHSDGYVDYSSSDIRSAMVSGIWSSPGNRIKFNILTGREKTGISWWGVPGELLEENRRYNPAGEYEDADGIMQYYENETDNYLQNHYHLFYSHLFSSKLTVNTGLFLTTGEGYYEEQKSDRDTDEYGFGDIVYGNDTITETDLVQRKWMRNYFYGALWSAIIKGDNTEWITGGGVNRYDGDHYGKIIWMEYPGTIAPDFEWYRNRGVKDEANIYTRMNAILGNSLSGYLDLQYRYIHYNLEGPDDDLRDLSQEHNYHFFNPKAGLFWNNGNGSDLFFSVSVAHREPTRSNFTDAAGDSDVTPQPERMTDFESGYSFSSRNLNIALNLYLMSYKNQLVPTGQISNTGYTVMTNVPESYRMGIEFSARYRCSSFIASKVNATISRNKILDFRNYYFNYNTSDWSEEYVWEDLGSVDIAYSPGFTGSAEVEINPVKEIALRFNGKYVGKQYFDNTMNDDRSIDPYMVCNMSFEYKWEPEIADEISLRLHVRNLFNTKYENNAYGGMWAEDGNQMTWSYFFPQAGINYMLGLSVTF